MSAAVLTVSDGVNAGVREDTSGDTLEGLLREDGFEVVRRVVSDDVPVIAAALEELADAGALLILTTGGTGFAPRDVTPEATRSVVEREAPGIAEAIRADAIARTPHALLSRGIAGLRGSTLVVNLPGSPGGCRDGFAVIRPALRHGLELAAGEYGDTAPADMTVATVPLPRRLASLVRIEHTVFALPFAYVGAFLAVDGWPGLANVAWVTVAMVGARTLAMSVNRLIDAELDARNPRTANRELPSGALSRGQVVGLSVASLAVFLLAVSQLEPIVRWLWPIPVAMFVIYPYLKRVTWLCHLWLGACLGLAPVGAWLAVSGTAPWEAWALAAAVALWVAGFDLFYSLFDLDHDRAEGLHSWAVRFGEHGVFTGARVFHAGTVVLLAAAGAGLGVSFFYWLGVVATAALLVYEHAIVRPGDLRRLDAAFFTLNGVISLVFFGFVALDVLVG